MCWFCFLRFFCWLQLPLQEKRWKRERIIRIRKASRFICIHIKNCRATIFLTRRNLMEKQTVNNRETENIIIRNMNIRTKLKNMRTTTVYRTWKTKIYSSAICLTRREKKTAGCCDWCTPKIVNRYFTRVRITGKRVRPRLKRWRNGR